MLIRSNKTTQFESNLSECFSIYKDKILSLHTKYWNEEDINGEGCTQYTIAQYHHAIKLVSLIAIDYTQCIQCKDWDYYIDKYNLVSISKRLACNGIDLEKLLGCFDLPATTCLCGTDGIECLNIEGSFEVEAGEALVKYGSKIDIKEALDCLCCECTLLIDENC